MADTDFLYSNIGPSDSVYTTSVASHLFMDSSYEPQRTNNFELQITGLNKLWRAGYPHTTENETHGFSAEMWKALNSDKVQKDLILSVKSAFTPKVEIQNLEVQYGNTKTKFAGIPQYSDGTIEWYDFYSKDTELILKAWQSAAFDESTGCVGDAQDYKLQAYLTMFSPSGRMARRWKLYNVWVKNVNGTDFANTGNDVRSLSAAFIFDYAVRLENIDGEVKGAVSGTMPTQTTTQTTT